MDIPYFQTQIGQLHSSLLLVQGTSIKETEGEGGEELERGKEKGKGEEREGRNWKEERRKEKGRRGRRKPARGGERRKKGKEERGGEREGKKGKQERGERRRGGSTSYILEGRGIDFEPAVDGSILEVKNRNNHMTNIIIAQYRIFVFHYYFTFRFAIILYHTFYYYLFPHNSHSPNSPATIIQLIFNTSK